MPRDKHHLTAYFDSAIVERLNAHCKASGTTVSALLKTLLTATDWASPDNDQIILPIPKALTNNPEQLRAELLRAVDKIVEHYRDK